MKRHFPLFVQRTFLSTCFLLLVTIPVAAKGPCEIQDQSMIDYHGPFSTLFSNKNQKAMNYDCSYPEASSPINDETITGGDLICSKSLLTAHEVGKGNLSLSNASGSIATTLKDISSYAIGGNLMIDAIKNGNDKQMISYLKAVELNKTYDFSAIFRQAVGEQSANSYEDFLAWAHDHNLTINNPDGSYHLNPSIFASANFQTTLKEQVIQIIETAKKVKNCKQADYANTHRCSPFYPIFNDSGDDADTSIKIAQMVLDMLDKQKPVESWAALSEKQKYLALSLHLAQSSPTFVLFLPVKSICTDNLVACAIKNYASKFFLGEPEPAYIEAILPETTNTNEGAKLQLAKMSPLKTITGQASAVDKTLIAENTMILADTAYGKGTLIASDPSSNSQSENAGQPITFVKTTNDPLLNKLISAAIRRDKLCSKGLPENINIQSAGSSADTPKDKDLIQASFGVNVRNAISGAIKEFNNTFYPMELYHVYVFTPPDAVSIDRVMSSDSNSILRRLLPGKTTGFDTKVGIPQAFESGAKAHNSGETQTIKGPSGQVVSTTQQAHVSISGGSGQIPQPGGAAVVFKKLMVHGYFAPLKSASNIKDQNMCYDQYIFAGAQAKGFDLGAATKGNQFDKQRCNNPIKVGSSSSSSNTSICGIAKTYNVPCEYLKAIWIIETNMATGCKNKNDQGPMQIADNLSVLGTKSLVDGHTLDKCNLTDAYELAARTLLWKMYGGSYNPNNPTSNKGISLSLDPNSKELRTTAQYNGSDGCQANNVTQCRWGKGKSYCDAVIYIIKNNADDVPWSCDVAMCKAWVCNPNAATPLESYTCGSTTITRDSCN